MKLNLFLISCLFAFLAGHMVNYSVIFLSLELFDSHTLAGLGFGLCFLPPIVFGWFAGVYCDRFSPRTVILIAQNSYVISFVLLYLAVSNIDTLTPSQNIILVLIAAFFSGVGWSFVAPARFASLPFYVSADKLLSASVLLNLVVMTGFGAAPLLLKFIQVNWQWPMVMMIGGVFSIVSSLILLPLTYPFERKPANKTKQELLESFGYVLQSKQLIQLLSLAAITYLLMGPMQVLLPSVAKDILHLSDIGQGRYLSLVALALVIGGISVMVLKSKLHFGLFLFLAIALAGIGISSLGLLPELVYSAFVLMLAAILGGMAISLIVGGIQHYAPDKIRGRIMSMYTIISQVVPALSGIVAGALASCIELTPALLSFGALILLLALLALWRFKTVRSITQLTYTKENDEAI
ncbi:MAG: MFS transporter [Gammaproteobacteria bacterium]|nr:MFS transporter [Gammaproteobacteria bacterium]